MEFVTDINDDEHGRILRASEPYAALITFLHRMIQIYQYRKPIFIFLFCSFLLLNHFYPIINIIPPNSPPNPHPNPDLIFTQTLKEQIFKLSLNITVDSIKKSNTQILEHFNHQDLSREQMNALKKCGHLAERSLEQLQLANTEVKQAIDDLDSFFDYNTACKRFRHIDDFLTIALDDHQICLQQFRRIVTIHHHHHQEGRSVPEQQNLLKSFVSDLKLPIVLKLSHSLQIAKEIEKDCREMLETENEDEMKVASLSDFGEEEEEEDEMKVASLFDFGAEEEEDDEAIDAEL